MALFVEVLVLGQSSRTGGVARDYGHGSQLCNEAPDCIGIVGHIGDDEAGLAAG